MIYPLLKCTQLKQLECIEKTSSEVAKELSITVGTLTVAINNLVKKGYVERIRSEDDRRVVKLGLTKKENYFSVFISTSIEKWSREF